MFSAAGKLLSGGALAGVMLLAGLGTAEAVPFRFGWTAPAEARVECREAKRGNSATVRWTLSFKRVEGSGDYRIAIGDFELVALNDMAEADLAKVRANPLYTAMLALVPEWTVASDGRLKSVGDLGPMIDAMLSAMAGQAGAAQIGAMLQAEKTQALLSERAASYWRTWVETFIGRDVKPGEEQQWSVPVPIGERLVSSYSTLEHLGPLPGRTLVRLRLTNDLSGPDYVGALAKAMGALAQSADPDGKTAGDVSSALEQASKRVVIEVETDPGTLRPRAVKRTEADRIAVAGEVRERVNTSDCRFDWAK